MSNTDQIVLNIAKDILNLQTKIINTIIALRLRRWDILKQVYTSLRSAITEARNKILFEGRVGNDQILAIPQEVYQIKSVEDAVDVLGLNIMNYINNYNIVGKWSPSWVVQAIETAMEGVAEAIESFFLEEDLDQILPRSVKIVIGGEEKSVNDVDIIFPVPEVPATNYDKNTNSTSITFETFKVLGHEYNVFGVGIETDSSLFLASPLKYVLGLLDYGYCVMSLWLTAKAKRPLSVIVNSLQDLLRLYSLNFDQAVLVIMKNCRLYIEGQVIEANNPKAIILTTDLTPIELMALDDPKKITQHFTDEGYLVTNITSDDYLQYVKLFTAHLGVYLVLYNVGLVKEIPQNAIPNFEYWPSL